MTKSETFANHRGHFEIIFDRFAQVSPESLNDKPKGTGLGLAICKEIITHYGGSIGLMSEKRKGCSFFFTLPAAGNASKAVPQTPPEQSSIHG